MKKEYDLKDTVWIHLGESKLVKGRVVEIIDLEHLDEGWDPDQELYVIEIKTGIDNVYEVREFGMISPDANGPIAAFRREGIVAANRLLKKIGMPFPHGVEDFSKPKKESENTPQNPTGAAKPKKYYYRRKTKK